MAVAAFDPRVSRVARTWGFAASPVRKTISLCAATPPVTWPAMVREVATAPPVIVVNAVRASATGTEALPIPPVTLRPPALIVCKTEKMLRKLSKTKLALPVRRGKVIVRSAARSLAPNR